MTNHILGGGGRARLYAELGRGWCVERAGCTHLYEIKFYFHTISTTIKYYFDLFHKLTASNQALLLKLYNLKSLL